MDRELNLLLLLEKNFQYYYVSASIMPIIIFFVVLIFVVFPIILIYFVGKGLIHGVKAAGEIGDRMAESQSKIREEKQQITQLESISRKSGKVFIDYGREKSVVKGYDSYLKSIHVHCNSTRVSQLFPSEYKHAVWRSEHISDLKSTYVEQWNKISLLAQKAVRLLEKRNRHFGNTIQDPQIDAIIELEDKALVGLDYICENLHNSDKIIEIQKELTKAEKEANSDSIGIKSIETRIATHKKRLAKQKEIQSRLSHIKEEVKSLEATFKLIIEEIKSSIQEHRLDKASNNLNLNYSLSELQLPILDQMFLEQVSTHNS